jgi:hypothetical protein
MVFEVINNTTEIAVVERSIFSFTRTRTRHNLRTKSIAHEVYEIWHIDLWGDQVENQTMSHRVFWLLLTHLDHFFFPLSRRTESNRSVSPNGCDTEQSPDDWR